MCIYVYIMTISANHLSINNNNKKGQMNSSSSFSIFPLSEIYKNVADWGENMSAGSSRISVSDEPYSTRLGGCVSENEAFPGTAYRCRILGELSSSTLVGVIGRGDGPQLLYFNIQFCSSRTWSPAEPRKSSREWQSRTRQHPMHVCSVGQRSVHSSPAGDNNRALLVCRHPG